MPPSPNQSLFDALARFRAAWPRRGWSYDNRFQCVASTFDADYAPTAKALVLEVLPQCWTDRTLASAPGYVAEIARRTGGVRAAQMVFSAAATLHTVPYGLWWPWEEGRTISLRIGLEGASNADTLALCNVFGTEP